MYGKKKWDDPVMKINADILKVLEEWNLKTPSVIQTCSIPGIVADPPKNFMVQSQNGSGKTLAYVISSMVRVDKNKKSLQVVAIAPTRELCKQIFTIYSKIATYMKVQVELYQSGKDTKPFDFPQVLISTAGGVSKLAKTNPKQFENVIDFVVDEADFFLSKREMVNLISLSRNMNPKKQILLFSATYSELALENVKKILGAGYASIMLKPEELTLKGVFQYYMKVDQKKKRETILHLFQQISMNQIVVFVNMRDIAQMLYDYLESNKISVSLLMGGNENKDKRDQIYDDFIHNKSKVLITTDLLSRGIDNRKISIVINYDLPLNYEEDAKNCPNYEVYLHRIGRTGRFGDEGLALNLITNESSMKMLDMIKQHYKSDISEATMDMLEKKSKEIRGDKYELI